MDRLRKLVYSLRLLIVCTIWRECRNNIAPYLRFRLQCSVSMARDVPRFLYSSVIAPRPKRYSTRSMNEFMTIGDERLSLSCMIQSSALAGVSH
jgi:hypothetical protein